jgi:fructan beta-fructosidase
MGWMSNWQYANQVPTQKWRNAMTLPREFLLDKSAKGYLLRSLPVVETEKLRVEKLSLKPGPVKDRMNQGPPIGQEYPLFEIDLLFEFDSPLEEADTEFGFILESKLGEKFVVAYNTGTQSVFMERIKGSGKADFSEHFTGKHEAPYPIHDKTQLRFQVFVDLSSIELFVNGGALVLTELAFPESGFESIHLYSNKEFVKLKEGVIYRLKSVW